MKIEKLDEFLREIARVELLSAEEELELLKAVKEKARIATNWNGCVGPK